MTARWFRIVLDDAAQRMKAQREVDTNPHIIDRFRQALDDIAHPNVGWDGKAQTLQEIALKALRDAELYVRR